MAEIPLKPLDDLTSAAPKQIKFIGSSLVVLTLFSRQVETPLLTVSQDGQGHAGVEGVFKQLSVSPLRLPHPLDLHENGRLVLRMAQGQVNTTATNGVFWCHDMDVKHGPTKLVQYW